MSSERPSYLIRVDQALTSRQPLADFLEAGLQRVYAKTNIKSKRWLAKLRDTTSAEELLASPHAVCILPVLLRHDEKDFQGLRRDTEILLRAQSDPTKTWKRIVNYPVVVLCVAFAMFLLQAYWISPIFEQMFSDFELKQHSVSRIVFSINAWTRDSTVVLVIALVLGFTLWGSIKVFGATILDRLQSIPWIGWIASGNRRNLLAMSRFIQTLAELIHAGAPHDDAIRFAADASQHDLLRRHANKLINTLDQDAFPSDGAPSSLDIPYPPLLIQVLRTEASSESISFLREMADTYRVRAETYYEGKDQVASPWMIFFIGAMILLLTLALFLPLLSLVTSLA